MNSFTRHHRLDVINDGLGHYERFLKVKRALDGLAP